jgi:uncharacterized protein with HEPN domain
MKRDDRAYLMHILDAIGQIETYVSGITYEHFAASRMCHDAVIRQIEVIGEATKNLSDNTRVSTPDIPWKDIAGMRDILIHQYFGVDLGAVWDTATIDLPMIKPSIEQLLLRLS